MHPQILQVFLADKKGTFPSLLSQFLKLLWFFTSATNLPAESNVDEADYNPDSRRSAPLGPRAQNFSFFIISDNVNNLFYRDFL